MPSFVSSFPSPNRTSPGAATLCRTRLGWVLGAVAIHGILFALLASVPALEVEPSASFPVEIITPESAHQPNIEKHEKPEPKRVPAPHPSPVTPVPVKREAAPTATSASAASPAPTPPSAPAAATAAPQDSAPAKAAEPGSSASQPRTDAAYLVPPSPNYPILSKRLGETGKVYLRVHVLPSGQPDQVEVRTTSGSARLDNAAMEAVRRARFVPRRVGGEAVDQWVLVPISFNLEN